MYFTKEKETVKTQEVNQQIGRIKLNEKKEEETKSFF